MRKTVIGGLVLACVRCGPDPAESPANEPIPSTLPTSIESVGTTSAPTSDSEPETSTPPVCSGMAGAPGTTEHTLDLGGAPRTWLLYLPEDLDPNEPVPVVFVFHGFTMSGQLMQEITTWDRVADREHLAVVYPDGSESLADGPWNVGDGVCGAGALANSDRDDFAFVAAMLDALAATQCIDRERVFATGFSMGGYFAHHLACRGPVPLRAIAPHSGGTYGGDCNNGPVPVMVLHGDADPLISSICGEEAAAEWFVRNDCPSSVEVEVEVEGGLCTVVEGCADETSVTQCLFDGMDHGWAGSSGLLYGGGAQYEDAAELAWRLFSR